MKHPALANNVPHRPRRSLVERAEQSAREPGRRARPARAILAWELISAVVGQVSEVESLGPPRTATRRYQRIILPSIPSPRSTGSGPSDALRAAGDEARRGPKSVRSPPQTTVGAWNKGPARMQDRTGRSRPETSAPER